MPNTNNQTIYQFGAGISQMVRQATGRDNIESIGMDWVTVEQTHKYAEYEKTGEVVSFYCTLDDPMKVVANINPVQDLHGYDSPWAAGGGKNLFNKPNRVMNVSIPQGTNIYSEIFGNGNDFSLYGFDANNTEYDLGRVNVGTITTHTAPADLVQISISSSALTVLGDRNLMVSLSTFTEWQPYANICPISGWSGANVTHTGKNILDYSGLTYGTGYISDTGEIVSDNRYKYSVDYTPIKPNVDYVFSIETTTDTTRPMAISFYDSNKNFIERVVLFTSADMPSPGIYSKTFLTSENASFFRYHIGSNVERYKNIMLEEGSVASAYESFGTTYPIPFSSTVYGGTLTINKDGSGKLVVNTANIASYDGETLPGEWISDRDVYAQGTTPTTGAQVVYELETPVETDLTELEVIETLKGVNNVWADTGPVSVIYITKEDIL